MRQGSNRIGAVEPLVPLPGHRPVAFVRVDPSTMIDSMFQDDKAARRGLHELLGWTCRTRMGRHEHCGFQKQQRPLA